MAEPAPPKTAEELLARYLDGPIPALRPGVTAELATASDDREAGVIDDGAYKTALRVPPLVVEAARAFDGRSSARDVASKLRVGDRPVSPEKLANAAVLLDAYFLLDTPRARRHADGARPLPALKPRSELTGDDLRFLPGARYDCDGNGGCCRGFRLAPILPADVKKLQRHDWRLLVPALADGSSPLTVIPRPDGKAPGPGEPVELSLAQKNGGCVFLDEVGLCNVHKLFGADEKPLVCRTFPYVGVRRLDGKVDVMLMYECSCIPSSSASGKLLFEKREEIAGLLREWPIDVRAIPYLFLVAPAVAVPGDFIDHFDDFAMRVLAHEAPPDERVLALSRGVQAIARMLGPLPEDESIDRIAARLATVDVERFFGESRSGATESRALLALYDCLVESGRWIAEEALWRATSGDDEQKILNYRDAAAAVFSLCRRMEDGLQLESGTAPFLHIDAAKVDPALDDPGVAGPLIEWVRNEVFGKSWYFARELMRGTGELIVRWTLVRWQCKRAAHARGVTRVEPRDAHAALVTMTRAFRSHAFRRAFDGRQVSLRSLVENPIPFGSGII